MPARVILPLLLAVGCLTGCTSDMMRHGLWMWFGDGPDKKVSAEFDGLKGHTVAIVVFADQKVQYEYNSAPLELSMVIGGEMRENVKPVVVVDPHAVARYQAENVHWEEMDRVALGRVFGADFVLYVALVEFTTREPGSTDLYRGRIAAEVSVWNTTLPEQDARVWRKGDLRVKFPADGARGLFSGNDSKIRFETERLFAVELVRKFHDHKVKRDP